MRFIVAILLPIICTLYAVPVCGQTAPVNLDQIVSRMLRDLPYSDTSVVTPDIRDQVTRMIRQRAGNSFESTNGVSRAEYLLLVRLGDTDAMAQVVASVRSSLLRREVSPEQSFLTLSTPPAVLPLIAADFFREDGNEFVSDTIGGDVAYNWGPLSVEMAGIALEIVARSDEFAPTTRRWACESNQSMELSGARTIRKMMQEWWRVNEMRFRERDYRAVTPGSPRRAMEAIHPDNGIESVAGVAPTPVAASTGSSFSRYSTTSDLLSASATRSKDPGWLWFLGFASMVAAAFLWQKIKRR